VYVPPLSPLSIMCKLTCYGQFCWGGKIVSLIVSKSDTPFKAGAECHPAMVDPSEALNIQIPLCMLASKDEPAEDVKKFEANLKGEKHVEIFGDQIHGWMTARSDLEDARVKSEYERGYKTLLEFYAKYL
jgi:dienelactone hydrolase